MADFYFSPEHSQQLLQEFLDASQSIQDINRYQNPPDTVYQESKVMNPSQSRAKVYGPNWMDRQALSPSTNAELPQKNLAQELMNQQIRRDSAGAALQLRDPNVPLRMPPPVNTPMPQGTPTSASLTGMRNLSPVLMFLDLLTHSENLNQGEDQQTGRAQEVDTAKKKQEQRNSTTMPTNNMDILHTLVRALSMNQR